MNITQIFITY